MELATESIKAKLQEYINENANDITVKINRYVGAWEISHINDNIYRLITNGVVYEVVIVDKNVESVSLI